MITSNTGDILLTCLAYGAKPAVNITWMFNNNVLDDSYSDQLVSKSDKKYTFNTESVLSLSMKTYGSGDWIPSANVSCVSSYPHDNLKQQQTVRLKFIAYPTIDVTINDHKYSPHMTLPTGTGTRVLCKAFNARIYVNLKWITHVELTDVKETSHIIHNADRTITSSTELQFRTNGRYANLTCVNNGTGEELYHVMLSFSGEWIPRNNGVLVTIIIFISILVCIGALTWIAYKIKCVITSRHLLTINSHSNVSSGCKTGKDKEDALSEDDDVNIGSPTDPQVKLTEDAVKGEAKYRESFVGESIRSSDADTESSSTRIMECVACHTLAVMAARRDSKIALLSFRGRLRSSRTIFLVLRSVGLKVPGEVDALQRKPLRDRSYAARVATGVAEAVTVPACDTVPPNAPLIAPVSDTSAPVEDLFPLSCPTSSAETASLPTESQLDKTAEMVSGVACGARCRLYWFTGSYARYRWY
ncbi:hypothetical protein BSL78_02430 [Apostichopus japonicus]|uniref:Ig-like domain-containing protein n=1 Tax=Stichopus japonicus TaxID=307972 RepID=A0A2G8LK94_STIJA|nr:hypothetical protein BSL78_02430 [Apostichopus japonicus]